MIFVTVGTHEQPFDRLVRKMDELVESGAIREDVFIQTGYCTYEPRHCQWSKFLPYAQMVENVRSARLVVTHGGPSSFIMPLQEGKIPVVVPRQEQFGEHVNDHQLLFARAVWARQGNILVAEDMEELAHLLADYDRIVADMDATMASHNAAFTKELKERIQKIL